MSESTACRGLARILVMLGAACIGFTAYGQAPTTAPRQDVTLRLDWVPTWYHSVFYIALNRGSTAMPDSTSASGKARARPRRRRWSARARRRSGSWTRQR